MPSIVEIDLPVPEKIFEVFIPYMGMPSWSYDLNYLYTHWLPHPIDGSHKIWFDWPSGFREDV